METKAGKVFLVDDDPSVLRALGRLLRSAGFDTECFESARAFLERPPYTDVGCLVLDLSMPDMTGRELQDLLQARHTLLPIVFLSGQCDVPDSVTAMKHGAVDFLLKPVDSTALLDVVGAAMQRHARDLRVASDVAAIGTRLARLSTREREVLEHVLTGRLNKQIAGELGIAEKTVKVHRGRLMAKMQVRSVAELVHQCDRIGFGAERRASA